MPRGFRTWLVRVLAPCALGAGALWGSAAVGSVPTLTVKNAPGRVVPSGFLGLGLEYRSIFAYTGNNPRSINRVFVQLVKNLEGGGKPIVRLGGQSTDRSWWPVRGVHRSSGITYDLTPNWAATARSLLQAIDARILVGVNVEAKSSAVTKTETRQLVSRLGSQRVVGVELGNEPELYDIVPWYLLSHGHIIPWYKPHQGSPVYARPKGYNFRDFTAEFARVRRGLPGVPLAGPATGNFFWLTQLPQFLRANPGLRWVTFHRYGLNGCVKVPSAPGYATVPHLLTPAASRGIMRGVGPRIAVAHHHHAGFLIDEMNSVTCNGRAGVSNSFASALWAIDAMFEMVRDGVDGVNIHTFPGASNGLFDFHQSRGRWVGTVHPVYYGLLMFAQAAPPGARLLRVGGSGGDVRVWATLAPDGRERVVLVNDSLRSAHTVSVRAAPVHGVTSSTPATLERLQARSAYSTGGVTIGGRSFGNTTTGLLGGLQTPTVNPSGGHYTVKLPASSAALLTISPH